MDITNEDFVKAWLEAYKQGKNQSWVAESLNTSRQRVSTKALYLRKKGVKLPKLVYTTQAVQVSELNALIADAKLKD
jgi:hypothetical protein